jgi:hypothetical protein
VLTRLFKIVDIESHISEYTGSYNAYINLLVAKTSLALVLLISLSSFLGVVVNQVLSNEFNGVLRSLFGHFRHGLEEQRYNSLVKVLPDREVGNRVFVVFYTILN